MTDTQALEPTPESAPEATSEATAGPSGEYIKLDQFLKLAQVVATGGQAKTMILNGEVKVNGVVETRRGRKLRDGDRVEAAGEELIVAVE